MAQTKEEIAELKDKFVAYFKDVPVQKYAAMYIGRTEQTIINWLKDDENFFNRVQEAKADWVKKKVSRVKAEFALERLEKEVFSPRQELTGPEGKDLGTGLSNEQIEQLIRARARRSNT